MEYNIISGDSHVDLTFLPEDLFIKNAPARWKERMPHVEESSKGRMWVVEDIGITDVGRFVISEGYSQGMRDHTNRMDAAGIFDTSDGGYHPTTPHLRLRDQDVDGVDAEVIYGLFNVSPKLKDYDQVTQIFKIYNDWIANFCKTHPDRFVGLACIPNHDPQVAAQELRRGAEMGLKGTEFGVSSASKPIYHQDWDVLWQASSETGMPISFHTVGWEPRRVDPSERATYERTFGTIHTTMLQLAGVEFLASTVFSGACERYPNFKFLLGECGISWLPYVLDRMDHEGEGQPGLTMKPSEYFHRQGYSTFQKESVAGDLIPLIGAENVIWGSDYPHPDGVWPDSHETIENNFRNLKSESDKRKVVCENAGKLYGLIK